MKLVLILIVTLFLSCRQTSSITNKSLNKNRVRTEFYTDTIRVLERDTAMVNALLECDSLGRVKIAQIALQQNDITNLKTTLKDNWLDVEVETRIVERYKEVMRIDTVYIDQTLHERIEIIKPVSWWERILIWIGGISIIVFIPKLFRIIMKFI